MSLEFVCFVVEWSLGGDSVEERAEGDNSRSGVAFSDVCNRCEAEEVSCEGNLFEGTQGGGVVRWC